MLYMLQLHCQWYSQLRTQEIRCTTCHPPKSTKFVQNFVQIYNFCPDSAKIFNLQRVYLKKCITSLHYGWKTCFVAKLEYF